MAQAPVDAKAGRKRRRADSASADSAAADGEEAASQFKQLDEKDLEGVDLWAPVPVSKDDPLPPPVEESSFATLFPKYREKYLREMWPFITKTLKHYNIQCELNLLEGSMTVKTTRKTWDPYAIIKARDLIKLLARSIPAQHAVRVMEDNMMCDIIKIKNTVRNKERFIRRRNRLIGPNGCTLKAIELVTGCYVMVQGNTVAVMGTDPRGLQEARKIVLGCMANQHPIYSIKVAMIKKELAADPNLREEDWSRFLPNFKRKAAPKKKKAAIKPKKAYTPFPPEQTPRKIDLELESGEYFLSKDAKERRAKELKKAQSADKQARKKQKLAEQFVPPEEE